MLYLRCKEAKMGKNKSGLLKPAELAKRTGLRMSTINCWANMGLLPFKQGGPRLMRRYPEEEALIRIQQIKNLKQKGLTLPEIIKELCGGRNEEKIFR